MCLRKMGKTKHKYRAIDLYSGIGGWSLGLSMAGIDVIASYEWWDKANRTNKANNNHLATEADIRKLSLDDLPKNIDIVVGSPPCTQFSYANRGGSGDIEDGLKDIANFLSIVDRVKPKFWAMENVPRVAKIIQTELLSGGCLHQFANLNPSIQLVDMCEWGVPQKRQRCIVGNFDFELLKAYRSKTKGRTLGDVINALKHDPVIDPCYEVLLDRNKLQDHDLEPVLSWEEVRINRNLKTFHPVYNDMSFPDSIKRAARTVTATCTRVSRESIVISAPESEGEFRRLTIRERGCLQGFPIGYQFFGDTYSQKLKMIGNAVPPLFTFYIAQAMLEIPVERQLLPSAGIRIFNPSQTQPPQTVPDKIGRTFRPDRKFRAAIPNLRFKSGVRFELVNSFVDDMPNWQIHFYFGNSKDIHEIKLGSNLVKSFKKNTKIKIMLPKILAHLTQVECLLAATNAERLQDRWCHREEKQCHPFAIVDAIGKTIATVTHELEISNLESPLAISSILVEQTHLPGFDKLVKNSKAVLAGLVVCAIINEQLSSKRFTGYPKKLTFN